MLLVIDNFDSFTYNLVDYFKRLGVNCVVYRNDVPTDIIFSGVYDGIVLSPGPETPKEAGNLLNIISYYENKLPILGICLGHQALGVYYGTALQKALKPMHGKLSLIDLYEDNLFNNVPSNSINVVRYHSLVLSQLPKNFICLSKTGEDEIMIMKHIKLPIYGIQFHPESILTEYGLVILNNWLIINRITEK